ncbi:MAG: ABC transporter ATP-binding protein/permease [Puniceicoccales bacterium]|jgi:subfamily B ATP-binding cassette protein MsbA|nr:ABC transporter ATP-binding protein/permease [Puniceicoccales bacterium]
MMKRFLPYYAYLLPVRRHFIGAVACGIIYGAASGFGVPFLMKKVFPVIFHEGGRTDLVLLHGSSRAFWENHIGTPAPVIPAEHVLAFAITLLPVIFAIRASAEFANKYLLNFVGLRVLEGVRVAIFARLQALHLDFFSKHKAGDLISRIMVDTNHVKTVIVDISNDVMIQPFTLIGAVGFIVLECVQTPGMERFLFALAAIPLVVLPVRLFGKKLRHRSGQMLAQSGNLSAVLTESLQSPREIRAYNLEERERHRFGGMVRDLLRAQMKMVKYEKMLSPLIEFVSACSIAFAIYQAAQVHVSQETALALVGALFFAYEPLKRLGNVHNRIKTGTAGLSRLEEVLHAPLEVADPTAPVPLPPVRGEVCFENVSFAYENEAVLREVNVTVRTGEVVALVGPSGAGKSTFANLVPRFYDPRQGTVRVDGVDVRTVRQAALRDAIALVSQEPILFNDTIYNNILLGRPAATREDVLRAAEQAGALAFIEAQPDGWDTLVGERGGQLSGGQRQRVAIARAFLKNAPILILDEATSALDATSEAVVQQALEELVRGKTTFIIAHRFSTIRFATRILVFDKGRIVADGPHETLLATSPLYRALYQRQAAEE